MQGFFEVLRNEVASKNITVTFAMPGAVKSNAVKNAMMGDIDKVITNIYICMKYIYLTIIPRARVGYEIIDSASLAIITHIQQARVE